MEEIPLSEQELKIKAIELATKFTNNTPSNVLILIADQIYQYLANGTKPDEPLSEYLS